ncbi:hypothetical protein HYW53_02700 [Candidatus Giovannonibacteria bacterium]|nr:hypothetical protein [Candidatus Giovannonibacteria bacterium]
MERFKKFVRLVLKIFLIFFVLALLIVVWGLYKIPVREPKLFGVTFVSWIPERFGMDGREVFSAVLDELQARNLRLPVFWDRSEVADDEYNFEEIDWELREAEKRNAKVILAVGRKLPRWPECHVPQWVKEKKDADFEKKKLLEFIEVVIKRYRDFPALYAWQIENEPFLPFGNDCPLYGGDFLDAELAEARRLDSRHPVIVTDSGELSLWARAARRADIFGTTLYRTVWRKNVGYYTYPLPPEFFRIKRALSEIFSGPRQSLVIELQTEPWGPYENYEFDRFALDEQLAVFNEKTFRESIEYAEKTGFDEFYLWGVEWWYWVKKQGHPEIWDEAKKLFL